MFTLATTGQTSQTVKQLLVEIYLKTSQLMAYLQNQLELD